MTRITRLEKSRVLFRRSIFKSHDIHFGDLQVSRVPDFKSLVWYAKTAVARPDVLRHYVALKRNARMSVDELAELNWQKRLSLLKFAYGNVPYYREKFKSVGLIPQDIRFREEWETVPTLTKSDLVEHFSDLLAEGVNKRWLCRSSTGGSTGVPVVVYHDRRNAMEAFGWRMLSWWGLGPCEDAAFAWRDFGWSRLERLRRRILFWPTRRVYLDASLITRATLEAYIEKCRRVRPVLVQGYVGAIESVADFILANDIQFPAPKAVWVTAAPVSKTQRSKMEAAFHAPVFDQYGCGEVFWIAAQCCKSDNLHVFSDSRCVEFLDDFGRVAAVGENGQIAVTDLENRVFPLIRYVNGDSGTAITGLCECGINLPLMAAVKGRTTDHLYLPDGSIIAGDYITTIFDGDPTCVKAFQVLQKKDQSMVVRVVLNQAVPDADRRASRVASALSAKIGGVVAVTVEQVAEIVSDRGKTRYVLREDPASDRIADYCGDIDPV